MENIKITFTKKKVSKENKTNKIYEEILNKVKYLLNDTNLTLTNLHIILKIIMEIIEETPLKGKDQKKYAIAILREIIDEKVYGSEEAMLLLLIDNGTIENLIDLIVDATKGKLNINAIKTTTLGCLNACIPYCLKKNK